MSWYTEAPCIKSHEVHLRVSRRQQQSFSQWFLLLVIWYLCQELPSQTWIAPSRQLQASVDGKMMRVITQPCGEFFIWTGGPAKALVWRLCPLLTTLVQLLRNSGVRSCEFRTAVFVSHTRLTVQVGSMCWNTRKGKRKHLSKLQSELI